MSSTCRREYCPRSAPVRGISARPPGSTTFPTASRSPESPATSRPRWSARAVSQPGQAKCTYGTGAFLLAHTGDRIVASTKGLITTRAASLGDEPAQFALEGSVFIAGRGRAVVPRRAEGDRRRPGDRRPGAPGRSGVRGDLRPRPHRPGRPPLGAGRAGTIFGLTRATSLADVARATLEGVAFQIADLIEAIQEDLGSPLTDLRVDGGMARSDPFLQFQADVLGQPIRRSPQTESTALGAALLAGLGVGLWPDRARARSCSSRADRPSLPTATTPGGPGRWSAGGGPSSP